MVNQYFLGVKTVVNLKITWTGDIKGRGIIKADNLETHLAIPKSFNGSGEGTDPKELLVSSAASCYITTLVAMLEGRKLPVIELTMDSKATNSKEEGLKIIHSPYVTLSVDVTEEQKQAANRAIAAADKACTVGNILKKADVQIDIEGKVAVALK